MTIVRDDIVTVNGVRSPLLLSGPQDSSTAVVFVHGNPGSSHDFRGLLATVGTYARGVALDMPGFGRADKPQDFSQTVAAHAAHLGGVLEQLGLNNVHLVLHDFGGPWGIAWALGNLGSVSSVTLIDTGVVTDHRWHWPGRVWMTPGIGELFARLLGIPLVFKTLFRYAHPNKVAPIALPASFASYMAHTFDRGTQSSVPRLYREMRHAGDFGEILAEQLRQHDIPSLVIWGARDHFLPVKHAYQQRAAFPSAQLLILDDAGHWPMITHEAETAAALNDFLRPKMESRCEQHTRTTTAKLAN